jgi:hypothetical protein
VNSLNPVHLGLTLHGVAAEIIDREKPEAIIANVLFLQLDPAGLNRVSGRESNKERADPYGYGWIRMVLFLQKCRNIPICLTLPRGPAISENISEMLINHNFIRN